MNVFGRLSAYNIVYSIAMALACLISFWITTRLLNSVVERDDDLLGGMWAAVATAFVFRDTGRAQTLGFPETGRASLLAGVTRLVATSVSIVLCLLYQDAPLGTGTLAGRSARAAQAQAPTQIQTQTQTLMPNAAPEAQEMPGVPQHAEAPLLEVEDLSRYFNLRGVWSKKTLHAVDDVSFAIGRREIVALVGESGSGKSTVARLLTLVYTPNSGEIRFEGQPISALKRRNAKLAYRGDVPMVFQDPYASINPAYRVSHGIMRAIELHRPDIGSADRHAEAVRVMEAVGLYPAEAMLSKYPYELSGGQRQRIGFAQALALRPKLIVADEPVSMLDVSIRVGVLNLMAELRAREDVSILYITHDLASARYVADRVIVMYAGHIVETGPVEQVMAAPRHPYTQLLLSAVPDPKVPREETGPADAAEPPKVIDPAPGCRFEPRCPFAIDVCRHVTPQLGEVAPSQFAACHVALMEARTSGSVPADSPGVEA